jgi:ubiquinone biosynthesis protein Coq4
MYHYLIRLRSAILVFLTHNMALPLLRLFRRAKPFPYSARELSQLPKGSLGNDLAQLLHHKQLQLLTHYARHDMKHILLGYDTTDEGEVCLQCFMLGNGRLSFPVLATVAFGVCTMPEHWKRFRREYKKGKQCPPISHWPWFELLPVSTRELQQRIFIHLNNH